MSNLANGRVRIKLSNSVLIQKTSFSFYSNFILSLYMVYELNNSQDNPSNNSALKNCLLGSIKLTRNAIKTKLVYNGQELLLTMLLNEVLVMMLLEMLQLLTVIIFVFIIPY